MKSTKPYGINRATYERELVLHCAKCGATVDETQRVKERQISWNAIIYMTSDWETALAKSRREEDSLWVRPLDVPYNQSILCYQCTHELELWLGLRA